LDLVAQYTEPLLDRIDAACETANAKLVWNWTNARAVVEYSNRVAGEVQDFHGLLGIACVQREWEACRLERAAEAGAQAMQKTKGTAPQVAAAGALLVSGVLIKNKVQGEEATDDGSAW